MRVYTNLIYSHSKESIDYSSSEDTTWNVRGFRNIFGYFEVFLKYRNKYSARQQFTGEVTYGAAVSEQDHHNIKAGHGCTLGLPGSLPTGIFRQKCIPGSAGILSHGSPGPTGILPTGHRSTGIKGTYRYSVVKSLRMSWISKYIIANDCFSA